MHNYKTGNTGLIGSIAEKVWWIIMNCKPNMYNQHETVTKTPKSHSGLSYREHNLQGTEDKLFIKLRWVFA